MKAPRDLAAMPRLFAPDGILPTVRQALRYGLVGLYSNSLLYLLYLALTALGVEHKLAMSVIFAAGVAITYHISKNWAFRSTRSSYLLFFKYSLIYASAYFLNLFFLWLMVDLYEIPHELVQGVLILVCAGFIFVSLKLWVF